MMKTKKLFIPMVFLLLLAFNVSPALAAKQKTWNIEYTLTGSIYDRDLGDRSGRGNGFLSLIVSGKVVGTPDYETEQSVEDEPIYYGSGMGGEYDYWEDETHYLFKYYSEASVEGLATYSEYRARWYSPQPTFNGKLVVIWDDGSTASFNVDLSPSTIEKSSREGTVQGTYLYFARETLYEEVGGEWILVKETVTEDSEDFDITYTESNIHILFSGKIQSKGRPPLKGTLELQEVVSGNYIMGYGEFGPYQLSIYKYTHP